MKDRDFIDDIIDRKGKPPAAKPAAKPAANGAAPHKLQLPEIYYEAPKKIYWARNHDGDWTEYPSTHIRSLLITCGLSPMHAPGNFLTPLEEHFHVLRSKHDVCFAGKIAGFRPGVHQVCGLRVLVTRGPKWIEPARGPWPTLKQLLGELLGEQFEYFLAWMKCALETLRKGWPFRPGQALALAGPNKCGKSFLQGVVTELLGGRVAKPWNYLSGETGHNGELLAAEHLMIEDEAASTDIRTRRFFGARLKNIIANEVAYLNPKGRDAINVTPFWRVTMSLNDEAENLHVLPPFDDSIKDKIILLKCWRASFPDGGEDLAARKGFRQRVSAELPAFVHYLQSWRIPQKLRDNRFGVKAFQNPDLLSQIESLEPEFRLLELIDTLGIWSYDGRVWEGTSQELQRQLHDLDKRGEVARVLYFNTACGVYLSRLKAKVPNRVSELARRDNKSYWRIVREDPY